MPDQIRVKRELFGRVSAIEGIVLTALQLQGDQKGKKASKEVPGPAFKPEIGFLKEDAPFDIGVRLKESTPEIIVAIKTALEGEFEGKTVEIEEAFYDR
jgi:hypothetical protein